MTKPIRILGRTVWIVLMTVISLLFAYPSFTVSWVL